MLGYKAVFPQEGTTGVFLAWCYWINSTTYEIGQTTKRREGCGPLTCFKDLADAKRFASSNSTFRRAVLLEVEYQPSERPLAQMLCGRPFVETCVVSFDDLPEGTVLADSITPIKVVAE